MERLEIKREAGSGNLWLKRHADAEMDAEMGTEGVRPSAKALGKRKAVNVDAKESHPNAITATVKIEDVGFEADSSTTKQLPTPAPTPTESTSSTFPSSSSSSIFSIPRSPSRNEKKPRQYDFSNLPPLPPPSPRSFLPLDSLVPAGTILLDDYRLKQGCEVDVAEDGWIRFSPDLLVKIPNTFASPAPEPIVDEPSQSPSKGRGKKRGRTKGGKAAPVKKPRIDRDRTLEHLIPCSQALVCCVTVRMVGIQAVARIYLVPRNSPELAIHASNNRLPKRPSLPTIRYLLHSIRSHQQEWDGSVIEGEVPMFMDETDQRSLLELFHEVEIPCEGGFNRLDASQAIKDRLWMQLSEQSEEITTDLFPYQRASVAKMLSRELAPQLAIPPTYLERRSNIDPTKSLYVSLNGDVTLSPTKLREPKGGILAEDMGVGKSLMVLALIMSTRSELPSLDGISTYRDNSHPSPPPLLLTRQSRDYPFEAEKNEALRMRPRVPELLFGALAVASVAELAQHEARLEEQRQADLEESLRPRPLPSLRDLMLTFIKTSAHPIRYPHDDPFLTGGDLFDTLQTSPPFYRLYPSQDQLDSREGRRGGIRPLEIIVAATTLLVVPTDLVRQWKSEIDKHLAAKSLRVLTLRTSKDEFPSAEEMAKYDVVLMSVARFTDAAEKDDRSLRGVHWKRLVVDEGHVLSSANLTRKLAEELRCESRWAVSGTPSTNLRGASVDGKLAAASTVIGGGREDLDRLGQIYSRFLRHPAFPKPSSLRDVVGQHPSRLANVFNDSIVRHRTNLVAPLLTLPPLSVNVRYVEMEEAERKMYNALTAIFASNAIQSQRKDQDYFFHKANAGPLKSLCSNLATASTFFASDEIGTRLREGAGWALERLESHKALKWTEEDKEGLRKVIKVMKEAYEDREWNLVVQDVSVAVEVEGLSDEIIKAFGGVTASRNSLKRSLLSLSSLVRLRQDLKELRHIDVKGWNDSEELEEELLTFEARRKRFDIEIASRKSKDEEVISVFKKRSKKDVTPLAPLPADSIFCSTRLIRTSSGKINYLLDQFRTFPEDKFIVFSSSNVDLLFANLSEALDLFGIAHIVFAGSHARAGADRGAKALRFNSTTAKEVQVILVDVEKGGRGVGLTAASRVIMLEPIWKPDLELQATKRAHRLGQTKAVDLQILIVKDTYEDALFKRRGDIAPGDFSKKVKVPEQDVSLRNTLQSAQYLEPTTRAKEGRPVSKALLDPPVLLITDGGHDVSRD